MVTKCLFRLNQMLYYSLCLSYHSYTEAVLFACFSSSWATTTGRLLGPKVETSLSVFPKDTATRYRNGNQTRFRNLSITSRALYQVSHAATNEIA